MQEMVNVYFLKNYSVPADLTIMTAMEYAGYTLKEDVAAVMDSVEHVQLFIESKDRTN